MPLLPLILTLSLCLFLLPALPAPAQADTWAIYWYICGSDLEDRFGSATNDIVEAANATYSDEVKVIVQTGGSKRWDPITTPSGDVTISTGHIERYLFDRQHTFQKLQSLPQTSMGKDTTLSDFITFCLQHYPADHRVLIIWDHGGGSTGTLANDQNFSMEGMQVGDIRKALERSLGKNPKSPAFDIIGFDACLMASLDVAMSVQPYASYMVASEETEPCNGWYYTPMLTALSQKTSMSGEELGRVICDTYLEGCLAEKTSDFDPAQNATLSVIDLSRLKTLKLAWNILGLEAISRFADDNTDLFLSQLGRAAEASEKFFNSKSEGFSNMMDMGSFIEKIAPQLPELSNDVLNQLKETVRYKVSGPGHARATGLSCYYPYDGGKTFKQMLKKEMRTVFVILQGIKFGLMDLDHAQKTLLELSEEIDAEIDQEKAQEPQNAVQAASAVGSFVQALDSITGQELQKPAHTPASAIVGSLTQAAGSRERPRPEAPGSQLTALLERGVQEVNQVIPTLSQVKPRNFDLQSLNDHPIQVSNDGSAVLTVGKEAVQHLESVYFDLALFDEEEDIIIILGKDADLYADWEEGVFKSHFTNHWAELDGHLIYLDVESSDRDTFYYRIPLKLNGKDVNLYALYNLKDQNYRIIGARAVLSEGIVDKNLIRLKPGDKIGTVFPVSKLSDNSSFEELEIDTFTLNKEFKIEDTDLGDARFVYMFEINDTTGNTVSSETALLTVKDGQISIEK